MEAEEREKDNLGKVLLEERRWYSGFVAGFSKPLVSLIDAWCYFM